MPYCASFLAITIAKTNSASIICEGHVVEGPISHSSLPSHKSFYYFLRSRKRLLRTIEAMDYRWNVLGILLSFQCRFVTITTIAAKFWCAYVSVHASHCELTYIHARHPSFKYACTRVAFVATNI